MKPKKPKRVECSEETVTLRVGEEFFYQFHRHGSVGEDEEFELSDHSIIRHERTEAEYIHPENMKPGWTGGDAERGQWFFVAAKPGKVTLVIRTLFRFEVEGECAIHIVVEP